MADASNIESDLALARKVLDSHFGDAPQIGLVLGSGLSDLVDFFEGTKEVSYSELPGFIPSTVEGHKGTLVAGNLGGVPHTSEQPHVREKIEGSLPKGVSAHTPNGPPPPSPLSPVISQPHFHVPDAHFGLPRLIEASQGSFWPPRAHFDVPKLILASQGSFRPPSAHFDVPDAHFAIPGLIQGSRGKIKALKTRLN